MKDVAERVGVSLMTISRALRNPEKVALATRKKIEEAIADLDYVPDLTAGTLSSQKSGFIAALVPLLNSSPFADTVQALSAHLRERGYQLLLGSTNYSLEQEESLLVTLLGRRPEAIVLTGRRHSDTSRRLLKRAGIPVVEIWDLPPEPLDMVVGYSNHDSGFQLCQRLIEKGHRAIGYAITSTGDDDRGEQRLQGHIAALEAAGLPVLVERVGEPPVTMETGAAAFSSLLAKSPELDAVVCVSDTMAVGALFECQRRGIAVPRQMAVAGFGDFEVARNLVPALTTVRVSGQEIGMHTAELLVQRLQGQSVQSAIMDVGVILAERETT